MAGFMGPIQRVKAFTLTTLGTCLLTAAVQAQDVVQAQGSDGTHDKILDPISVTATRNPIKAFEYPGMVTVVGREEIESRQASTPDDILNFVPNVEFTGGPRRTGEVPSIRGFDGPDVIVLIDGARQNFGSAHDGRFFVDPSLLKQVEVLRGPASSLYGSGGTGGVIEFQTIDASDFLAPDETFGAKVSAGYQTVNRERLGTMTGFATPVEGLDFVGSITRRESGSIELGDGSELNNTDDDIVSGLFKGSYEFADHHSIEGSFSTFRNDAQEPNNGQATTSDVFDKEVQSDNYRVAYKYDNPNNDLINLDVIAYYTDQRVDEVELDPATFAVTGELLKRNVDTYGFRLDNRSRLSLSEDIGVTFTYGGEYYEDEQDGARGSGDRDGVPDAEASFFGAFSQAEITVSEAFGVIPGDFLIIPGLRFDSYEVSSSIADSNEETALSPRLGVSYLPTDWLLVFANYAEAFRAPTFDELFTTGTHFQIPIGPGVVNRFVPNSDLSPQTTQTFEFGGGLTFNEVMEPGDLLQFKASHFLIWGEDFIDQDVDQPTPFVDCNPFIPGNCDGTTTTFNVPEAKLWGSEIEASYENDRFLVSLGFSRIDGENEETGEKIGTLTPDQVTVNTAVKLPEINSLVGWRVLAADKFDEVDTEAEERDGYAVHDVYFSWQPTDDLLQGIRVDLGVDNIFDKSYERVNTNANEPGRNFKGLVSYSLKW
ncbi:TonB-dependent hemoglobin/transferrin/lactoferrin family receptor [Denitrobaculum tricleocarpae]|uniref:TonB-dependent hemoglobin/transferrin/lactoferrin family receptor n=1 Tax=Denitrobaculum tricleocarpae TaxID=2591009 RepID=A0A545U0Y0_9PROT|nr:TonB-dependent hemoglobin/transferrin/lactoferrin family receptor [Denitrobaculum tricleocarpae]TQV83140.1 TonB-dependent hemoglobin/transferrin/lactoferrin family receptor [Denitrobaculum tricleocarpae]